MIEKEITGSLFYDPYISSKVRRFRTIYIAFFISLIVSF